MNKTYKLAATAMLTALSIVANLFTINISLNNAISFTILLAFIAGIYLGPTCGMAVGFVGDLVGHLIMPMGPYNWFMGLSCILMGLIPALVYKLPINKILKLLISLVIYLIVCSVFLNTFGFWLQFCVEDVDPSPIGLWHFFTMDKEGIKKSFWVYLGGRAPFLLINWVVNGFLVGVIQQTKIIDKLIRRVSANNTKTQADDATDTATAQSDDTATQTDVVNGDDATDK
ncbi:MAG: folate family ECF transporter S component [Clostridia bacterium]|nr:folate family ECF transporter S component [Clostridia bacterium]